MSDRVDNSFSLDERRQSPQISRSSRRDPKELPPVTQQWFPTETETQPAEPDMTRFITLLAAHGLPIVPEGDLNFLGNGQPTLVISGAFGEVRMATWKSVGSVPRVVAIKQFKETRFCPTDHPENRGEYFRLLHDLFFEIEIMSRCNHRNVAKVLGISFCEQEKLQDKHQIRPMLLLEPANFDRPDLSRFFGDTNCRLPMPIKESSLLVTGIADGLCALHSMGVVHADLKPENILMFKDAEQWIPKLSDFGLSGITSSSDAPRGGTRRWNAPECLPSASATLRAFSTFHYRDVYAFGLVTAYILQNGHGPFDPETADIDQVKLDRADIVFEHIWKMSTKDMKHSQFEEAFAMILKSTLRLWPENRWPSLLKVGELLQSEGRRRQVFPYCEERDVDC
jgi:serine/threonine protein kinase